ncbi:hypothetical protein [Portibacter marinus]|uniref:hypothetical protein n=1 Tax=Portibacter marinus TaxID=2898660 RepID=UPI001F2D0935|nr:hypothetical protein [Portibacter marinus]
MKEQENNEIIDSKNISTRYGVIAGVSISIILLLFQLAGSDFEPVLKISAMIPLAVCIALAFNKIKSLGKSVFPSGVSTGLKLSLIAAISVLIFNLILFLISKDLSFSKYAIIPETGANFLTVSVILLFEIFVFGGVMSFILMQSMKRSSKTR